MEKANPDIVARLEKYDSDKPFSETYSFEMSKRFSEVFDEIKEHNDGDLWPKKNSECDICETVRCLCDILNICTDFGGILYDINMKEEFPFFSYDIIYFKRDRNKVCLFVDNDSELSFSSETEKDEITKLLKEYNIHPMIGSGLYLTDWLIKEKYMLTDKYAGWGTVDDGAVYIEICLKKASDDIDIN